MKCATCGAAQGDHPPLYCRFCGARRAGGVDEARFRTDAERYELVAREPAFAAAMRHTPRLGAGEIASPVTFTLAAATWCAIATGMTGLVGAGTLFRVAFVGVGVGVTIVGLVQLGLAIARVLAPTRRDVAVLVGDRVRLQAERVATLRLRDGATRDVVATAELMGLVTVGDIGIAYTQGDRLVDFRWFDVMPAPTDPDDVRASGCPHCAAPRTFDTRATCTFCGGALPSPDLGALGAALAAVHDAAAAVPEAPPADPRKSPLVPLLVLALGAGGLYLAWWGRVAWFFLAEAWPWLWLCFAPFVPLTIVGAIWLWRRIGPRPPPVRGLARVVRRRRALFATVNDRPIYRTFVTLASASGARREVQCEASQWERITPDDVGVAWLRGDRLVAFADLSPPSAARSRR